MTTFELKLADGRRVWWEGADGPDAGRNYVDGHREAEVVAWREDRRPLVRMLLPTDKFTP